MTLLPQHRERLETTSAVSAEVVSVRGYYSVESRDELRGLGFPKDIGAYLPALVIPLFGLVPQDPGETPGQTGRALRPDKPYAFKDGHVAKYLHPGGQANVLDVLPTMRPSLLDPDVPLLVTEGTIKADAAASVQLVTIALAGVDGWMHKGAPQPTWELVPLKGRQTLIAFDSDVTLKRSVRAALSRLVSYLRHRGANVEVVQFPPGPAGQKCGLDDFLRAHRGSLHPIGPLLEHAVSPGDVPDGEEQPARELPADVTGADVLDGLSDLLRRYIRFSQDEQVWGATLWIAMTHVCEAFEIVPYLAISSATMRSGKSHLLDLVRWTCARGRRMSAGSDAAIFRTLNASPPPTLVFDEVDNYIGESTERAFLVGVLNEGFEKDGVVARVEEHGGTREVVDFKVFGPKCFVGIGSILPTTTLDRCIRIALVRRLRSERVAKWRARRVRDQADGVRELLAGWALAAEETVAEQYDRDLPFSVGTSERAEDVWEALIAVAEAAGGKWPARARQAALALTPAEDDAGDLAVQLLADIRRAFSEANWPAAMKSGALVHALNAIEEAPWGGLRDGKGLSTHRLARDLQAFGLSPGRRELDGETVRGWWRDELKPVWERYVPEKASTGETASPADQSVGLSVSPDFPLNQAVSGPDALIREDAAAEQSVGNESPANQRLPDSPTLQDVEGAETPNRTIERHEPNAVDQPSPSTFPGRHPELIDGQLSIGDCRTVVEESTAEGLSQTLDLGDGPPAELHRLPPDAPAAIHESLSHFLRAAAERKAVLAVDCETTGTDPYAPTFRARIWSVSDGREGWALDARDERARYWISETLDRYPHALAIHNIAYDIPAALQALDGLDPETFRRRAHEAKLVDTMVLARLRHPDESRVGLKEIASRLLGAAAGDPERRLKLAFKHVPGSAAEKWAQIDSAHPAYWTYAAADAVFTARLHERLREPGDGELLLREMRVATICLRAGLRGWAVDLDAANALDAQLAADEDELAQALRRDGISNITTAAGRAAIIAGLAREGAYDLDPSRLNRSVLEPLALGGSTIAANVLRLRTSSKLHALYAALFVGAGERDGRLHAFPLTLGTVTGRMALRGVPLQTVPKGELALANENGTISAVRSALVAEEGYVTGSVDFQAMELRIAAALSQDARLSAAVANGDVHAAIARTLFQTNEPTAKQRAIAKTVNFGALYGMGAAGLAPRLRISEDDARRFLDAWWERFPALRKLRYELADAGPQHTLWGRPLPHHGVPDHIRLNHLIQGTARDVFCDGLLALEDAGLDQCLLLPLHDEYVVQLPADDAAELAAEVAALVRTELNGVPLLVDWTVGARSWASVGADR